MIKQKHSLLLLSAVASLLLCCKKTEVVPYDKTSNNTILSYRVSNTADSMYGAIDNVSNIITLYIPYYSGIDYIVPDIKTDKDAKLLDDAGNVINPDGGIAPVPVDTIGYKYTVLGSDNAKRVYSLVLQTAPSPETLKAGYTFTVAGGTTIDYNATARRAVYGSLPLYGNFGSTSTKATFKLTNTTTGKVYTNILSVSGVTPGANYYTMLLDISPEADSGNYHVEMTHQARTATLPDLHLVYNKPKFSNLKSTAAYGPGDTITFAALGRSTSDTQNGSIIGLQRVYMKFTKSGFDFGGSYPATFPTSLFGQEVEMKIVSMSRTEVKVIFPDLPDGAAGAYLYSFSLDLPGIAFFFDFSDDTGWGKNNMLATIGRLFTINEKKQ